MGREECRWLGWFCAASAGLAASKEELDGIIYQEVPQPGHPGSGTRSAEEYGCTGAILGSPGHIRVTVGPGEAKIEYVQTTVAGVTNDRGPNGRVGDAYALPAR